MLPITGCIVQGNCRPGTLLILLEMSKHFNHVYFSTWDDFLGFEDPLPNNVEIIKNKYPSVKGFSNRNLQRLGVNSGLIACKKSGCEYVLKWRSDMLPTRLDVSELIKLSKEKQFPPFYSGIVAGVMRTRSVSPDWYSSVEDFYHFGTLEMIELLWSDSGIDYEKMFNPPSGMIIDLGDDFFRNMVGEGSYFCAEQELYAWFKYRLEIYLQTRLQHREIMKFFWVPIENSFLGVCWFGGRIGLKPLSLFFRPYNPGIASNWWTYETWRSYDRPVYNRQGLDMWTIKSRIASYLNFINLLKQIFEEFYWITLYIIRVKLRDYGKFF